MLTKPRSRQRPSRANTSPEAVTAYALLDPTNSTAIACRAAALLLLPLPRSTVMVPLLLLFTLLSHRRRARSSPFVRVFSFVSIESTDGRDGVKERTNERTNGRTDTQMESGSSLVVRDIGEIGV